MKIIFAQGNPGTVYAKGRHNSGFMVLDAFASSHNLTFRTQAKFQAEIAELNQAGGKTLLVKPTTFYNETGQSARALVDFYKLVPSDFLIIHDELALPFGTIRSRQGGSDAGNNGIKSLNSHIGVDTARIRIGVANPKRELMDDADFVLGRFNSDEAKKLPNVIKKVSDLTDDFLTGSLNTTSLNL